MLIAGVAADAITNILLLTAAVTAFTAGISRYGEVLRLRRRDVTPDREGVLIERATAIGFFIGVGASAAIAALDAALDS